MNPSHDAAGERIAGPEDVQVVSTSRLVGIDEIAGRLVKISKRAWLRLCDQGLAPWGVKLGARRLWNLAEIDAWIAGGCKPVQAVKEGQNHV